MKPLPRVVCSIDGSTLPVQDYSFTSVADGGYHEFRGQAPLRKLLALGADQEAPLTVYHEETGDILWDGRFVTDPEVIEGIGLISATGPKAELEKAHGRLLFQSRDVSKFTDGHSPPHSIPLSGPLHKIHPEFQSGALVFTIDEDAVTGIGDETIACFWAPGNQITRIAWSWISSELEPELRSDIQRSTGPSGARTDVLATYTLNATSGTGDQAISPAEDMVIFRLVHSNASPKSHLSGYAYLARDIRVNGIASGDTLYAHEVLQHLGGRIGFNTSLIDSTGLNVLPLDWIGSSWASLADYIVSLLDWRWLISTIPSPGTGLVQYLEAGAWGEQEWSLFKSSARPNLKPQQRRNEAVVTYRDVGGAEREVRVRADPDPLAKWGVVRTVEATLADVQSDSTLALALAATLANRHAEKLWVGDIDAANARDDSGRGDARLVKPGDIGRLADWGPSEETFHRIHGTEQTQTSVRYSIESPISAAPLIEGAALERARRPSESVLPELELSESGEPAVEEDQRRARLAAAFRANPALAQRYKELGW